ncbi:MAG: GIY-YIG nuclease family protein [Candidatus Helarchaeota archaeon]
MIDNDDFNEFLKKIPNKPGVYFFKSKNGEILYIGKANDIQKRVLSHLKSSSNIYLKDEVLNLNNIEIDYEITNSEINALLLEAKLIRKYKPKYNIRQKDDTSFPYIVITTEDYPRILLIRNLKGKKTDGTYYGPFTSVKSAKRTIYYIQQVWKIASCNYKKLPSKSCLKAQIDLCSAPCVKDSISIETYSKQVKEVKEFLGGKNIKEIIDLKLQYMKQLADELRFEEAAKIRDQIKALNMTIENYQVRIPQYFIRNSLKEIKKLLNLPDIPNIIEAFDISNIGTEFAVGAMVQFENGYPNKNNYRRFKIKSVEKIQNDVLMIQEIIRRRYSRLLKENASLPDLVLIDGGKGQLTGALKELEKLNLNLNVIALAKEFDNIYVQKETHIERINLKSSSPALLFLKRVRDEVHRFAIKYHKLVRLKQFKK